MIVGMKVLVQGAAMISQDVSFHHFARHVAALGHDELLAAAGRVLTSGWYILGAEVKSFEEEFAAFAGVDHAVGVANGTEAIALALMALGVGPGDEVITADLSAYPTITGIQQAGATPVVVDVNPKTGLINTERVAERITPRTRALLPVHLYGQCCDMDALSALARDHDLLLIEDCAQSVGATWRGQPCGSFGDCGCFSFYPTKNLGAFGDAGAVSTKSAAVRDRLIALRNYGQSDRYRHDGPGINSRLDELQAAFLRLKLPHVAAWTERRREVAAIYDAGLEGVGLLENVPGAGHVRHLYPVLVERRAQVAAALAAMGVQTLIHYPIPVHRQGAFPSRGGESFPGAEYLAERVLSLPMYPELEDEEVGRVVDCVNEAVRRVGGGR